MAKSHQVGPISFSESGYKKFVSLSKEKQIEKVTNALNPKDPKQAEKILSHVPNGNVSTGNDSEAASGKTDLAGGDAQDNNARSEADSSEGTGAKKGRKS